MQTFPLPRSDADSPCTLLRGVVARVGHRDGKYQGQRGVTLPKT